MLRVSPCFLDSTRPPNLCCATTSRPSCVDSPLSSGRGVSPSVRFAIPGVLPSRSLATTGGQALYLKPGRSRFPDQSNSVLPWSSLLVGLIIGSSYPAPHRLPPPITGWFLQIQARFPGSPWLYAHGFPRTGVYSVVKTGVSPCHQVHSQAFARFGPRHQAPSGSRLAICHRDSSIPRPP